VVFQGLKGYDFFTVEGKKLALAVVEKNLPEEERSRLINLRALVFSFIV
jgi:hypothetical protein